MRSAVTPALGGSFLLLWEATCRLTQIPNFILPRPSSVIIVAIHQAPLLLRHSGVTMVEILMALALALVVAMPLSMTMFRALWLERALAPLLIASQAIPVFALAPVLVLWFGYGVVSKVVMAAVIVFFPITVTLLEGFKSCDPKHVQLFRLMGYSFWETMKRLYWPWTLPYFFAGLRVAVSVATIGAVIGEWVGAQKGLGFLMIQSNARLKTELVFAAILYLTVMGLSLWWIVGCLAQKYGWWMIPRQER
ncbi:MAG: ABC transporter permease [Dethiosulfovibrio peptidovorans]|nr:MAG: ABC transporter permease [Dethiosulfovibrio peptidovorans]